MIPEQDDTCNNLITKRVDADEVGGMLGISAAFLGTINALAPVMGGAVFQAVGPAMPFLLGGAADGSVVGGHHAGAQTGVGANCTCWAGALSWGGSGRFQS